VSLARLLRALRPPRRLRFTREGRYFVLFAIGVGLAALNTGNNLLYLLLGWLLSMILASGVLSEVSMRGLRVTRHGPAQVFANRPFLVEIAVANDKRRAACYSVEVEDVVAGVPLDKKCFFLKVPPGREQRASYRHTFSRRGRYRYDGFRVSTKFPFGLFRKSRTCEGRGEILVYPSVHAVTPPAPRGRLSGDAEAAGLGRRGEFFGLREYRPGDDQRDVHWRSTARSGRLLVREYQREAQLRVTLALDDRLPPDAGPSEDAALEEAVSLAASLASAYVAKGYAVRLVTARGSVPYGVGEAQRARVLRFLALLEPSPPDATLALRGDPRAESLLVTPRGIELPGRPADVTHVVGGG
jgi:uncharacterized protein (DUF58 family)